MIADLHAHYPMHLCRMPSGSAFDLLATARGRDRPRDRLRARLVGLAGRFANYRSFESGPRVTLGSLRDGGVGVAFSVLYRSSTARPRGAVWGAARCGLPAAAPSSARDGGNGSGRSPRRRGEGGARRPGARLRAGAGPGGLRALRGGRFPPRFEPGGDRPGSHRARRPRVAYITLPHLLWRGVAATLLRSPSCPTGCIGRCFPSRARVSELGRAAVTAMAREACSSTCRT